ncbi:MAG: hypothetical protein K9K79_11210, partial [Desulfohalobiaceae bacterium]|nr:hypothetical protein [Desulfohalobiaceae bacterium]
DPKKLLSFSIDHTGKDGLQHDVSNCRPVNSYILINYVSALPEAKLTPETSICKQFTIKCPKIHTNFSSPERALNLYNAGSAAKL